MGYLLIYKLFEKTDKLKFLINFNVHFESNIPSTIIYGSIFSEFLCISRCLLKLGHFLPRASERFSGVLSQQGNQSCINRYQQYIRQNTITNKNRKRNIIWFNPPYSANVVTKLEALPVFIR